MMLVFVIALIVFGPDRLPGMARQAGRYINQLRRLTQDARSEIQSLTKDLDIREDLNTVKADLMSIRDDLTSTATGITKDFENIRKDITLRDENGNTMGAQREQYTYSVKDSPSADGSSEGVVIEETITRETIIQDAVENTPTVATEVITSTTSSEGPAVVEGSAIPVEATDPALRVIRPARPMDEPAPEAAQELTATESVVVDSGTAAEEAPSLAFSNPFATPFPDVQPVENSMVSTNGTEEAAPEPKPEEAPVYTFAGTPAAQYAMATNGNGYATSNKELEESLEKTRQEFNERIDKMESQFMERLERVEKLLASQFVRAHQEQGG